jgi:hypothetical protein
MNAEQGSPDTQSFDLGGFAIDLMPSICALLESAQRQGTRGRPVRWVCAVDGFSARLR